MNRSAVVCAVVLVAMQPQRPSSAAPCAVTAPRPRIVTGSNCVYDVALNEFFGGSNGAHGARTGERHPVTLWTGRNEPVVQATGRSLITGFSGFSVRSWTAGHDVLFDYAIEVLRDDRGYTCDGAFVYPSRTEPVTDASGSTVGQRMRAEIAHAGERLDVDLLIAARGTEFDDSAVEITAVVTNAGAAPVAIGARSAWFVSVWTYTAIAWTPGPVAVDAEPWQVSEAEVLAPGFEHVVIADNRTPSALPSKYFAAISSAGPAWLEPPPTQPCRIALGHDAGGGSNPEDRAGPFDTCFDWHPREPPPADPPGNRGGPVSIAYWWGDTPETAIILAPGESRRFTVWEWAYLENPVMCDAGSTATIECAGATTSVPLDGTASFSSGGSPLRFLWTSDDAAVSFDDTASATPTATVAGAGIHEITLTAFVGPYESSCTTTVEVVDTTPPVLDVDLPVTVLSSTLTDCTARVAVETRARDTCDGVATVTHVTVPDIGSGGAIASHDYPIGTTRVLFTARDAAGNETVAETAVTVIDDVPPQFTRLEAIPSTLWPPNHRFHRVLLDIGVSDDCDTSPEVTLMAATSSEPDDARGDGRTLGDIQGIRLGEDDRDVSLRAERSGRAGGRTYSLRYRARDANGNTSESEALVRVEHDRRIR